MAGRRPWRRPWRRPGTLTHGARCFLLCTAPTSRPLPFASPWGRAGRCPHPSLGGGEVQRAKMLQQHCASPALLGRAPAPSQEGDPSPPGHRRARLGCCRAQDGRPLSIPPRHPRGALAAGRAASPSSTRIKENLTRASWPFRSSSARLFMQKHQFRRSRWCSGV